MKRIMSRTIFSAALVLTSLSATAQNQFVPAEREELASRIKRLELEVEDLKTVNVVLKKNIQSLDAVYREVQSENDALRKKAGPDDILKLSEAIKQVDRKRLEDREKLLQVMEEIKKAVAATPAPVPHSDNASNKNKSVGKTPSVEPTPVTDSAGVYHTVAKDQTLGEIIKAYNDDLKAKGKPGKITLKQVLDANKGLDDKRMRVGQKIFIPIP